MLLKHGGRALAVLFILGVGVFIVSCQNNQQLIQAEKIQAEKAATIINWPSQGKGHFVDARHQDIAVKQNSSGIAYQSLAGEGTDNIWVVNNELSRIFKMKRQGDQLVNANEAGWKCKRDQKKSQESGKLRGCGKKLRYPNGKGKPDVEGVTITANDHDQVFVATERNGTKKSRLSVLRFNVSLSKSKELIATHEWKLNNTLPRVKDNKGLEGIAWIADDFLEAAGFKDGDERAYIRSQKAHFNGLFFLSLEQNGHIYAYALFENGDFELVAEFDTNWSSVVGLEFDRQSGLLWAICDDSCKKEAKNRLKTFRIQKGKFIEDAVYEKHPVLAVSNYEGIALSECSSSGVQSFFWINDKGGEGTTIFEDQVSCPLAE